MFGEALEDLESCGQSELLRELEVGHLPCGPMWGTCRWAHWCVHLWEASMLMGLCSRVTCMCALTQHPLCKGIFTHVQTVHGHTCRLCMDMCASVTESIVVGTAGGVHM